MNRIAELLAESLGEFEVRALNALATDQTPVGGADDAVSSLIELRLVKAEPGGDSFAVTRLGWDVLSLRKPTIARIRAA